MKKTSTIVKEKETYEIDILINNTAYIKSITGKSGLLNINTNKIIGKMDYYYTIYDKKEKFYIQINKNNKTLSLYDALNEKMIIDNYEIVEKFDNDYHLVLLKSPIDGKMYLYDKAMNKNNEKILNIALDSAEKFYYDGIDKYLIVSANNKKGIYYTNTIDKHELISPIEFDEIEKLSNIIVYTKDNQKYFVCDGKDKKTSVYFDEIIVDKNNENIVYCKKGNKTYIYETYMQELLLSSDYDNIEYMFENADHNNISFFFKTERNGKQGMICSEINNKNYNSKTSTNVSTVLKTIYDEIIVDNKIYLKKDGKIGLFVGDQYLYQVLKPEYDNIEYLRYNYFALYNNCKCDISIISQTQPSKKVIENCEIIKNTNTALIYKNNDKYGLLYLSSRDVENILFPAIYDNIDNIDGNIKNFFIIDQNNKKGLIWLGKIIIPTEYDEIKFGGSYDSYGNLDLREKFYISLKKEEEYELAKKDDYYKSDIEFVNNHTFKKIDFFREIMVLTDNENSYIYDYNEKLLKLLPSNIHITSYERPSKYNDYKEKYFYSIDNTYYYYKDGKLKEVYTDDIDCYLTTYETNNSIFEIKTYNKSEHDTFCSIIDSKTDIEAEKDLTEMIENGLPRSYNTLVLKKIK